MDAWHTVLSNMELVQGIAAARRINRHLGRTQMEGISDRVLRERILQVAARAASARNTRSGPLNEINASGPTLSDR
ncbi:hypothetical protein GCM10010862_38360 [Devosia nitrariae]|uniref:Uncharacterized protein n=1 Tax=Devosia nitrariae TaxID=2071872 RepID=A0ABQ5W9C4_9HYPH|nr:hypothetical protein GCM10010862_38360 [Devosia nitrariae]